MADDIVERLRAAARSGEMPLGVAFDAIAVADEIERLRVAGRALHAWITVNATFIQQERKSHDEVLNGWEEACRV